jgi:iron complex outermembrane receptor protein
MSFVNNRVTAAIAFTALILFDTLAFASDETQKTLAPVVVTAKKTPEEGLRTGDSAPEETTTFHVVIPRESFDGKMESIDQVIEKEAGVQVTQTGGLGSYSTVSLRGSSSDQVMVYLDGILLNEASGGGVDLSTISLSDVESVEIYKGAAPIQFTQASLGGVVNIKTLRAKKSVQRSITAGYGSFDTWKMAGLVNHKPGNMDYLLSADFSGSENDFDFLNPNNTGAVSGDDFWEKRNHAALSQRDLLAKIGYDVSPDLRVDLLNQYFEKDQELPERRNDPHADIRLDTTRNITSVNLIRNRLTSLGLNTRTRVEYMWKEEAYQDRYGHLSHAPMHFLYATNRYAGDLFLEWPMEYGLLSTTLEVSRETFDADNKNTPIANDINQSSRTGFSAGTEYNAMLFDDRLRITPSLYYTRFSDHRERGSESFGEASESVNKGYATPRIGLQYALSDGVIFKTNAARYIREPSFFELFGDRGYFKGNPDISPEKGVNMDMGAEIRKRFGQQTFITDIFLGAAFFVNRAEDLIVMVYDSGGNGRAENIASSKIQGIESSLQATFLNHVGLTLNTTLQDTDNESALSEHDGKELPGRFRKSFLGRVEYRLHGFKVFTEYVLEKEMFYDIPNTGKAKDKKEINAGVSLLYHHLLLTVEGKNLGDDIYEEFYMYPLPGRSVSVTVKYHF